MGDDGEESSKPLLADSEGKKEINNIYVFHIKTSRGAKRGMEFTNQRAMPPEPIEEWATEVS